MIVLAIHLGTSQSECAECAIHLCVYTIGTFWPGSSWIVIYPVDSIIHL